MVFRTRVFLRHILALVDGTVLPANASAVQNALNTLATVLSLSVNNVGHVQLPVPHSNTTPSAVLKHRRTIEDGLMASDVDVTQTVALHFSPPSDARSSDRRNNIQTCIFAAPTSTTKQCAWTAPSLIGPLSLIKTSEMIGYDADARPGPTVRTEQNLGFE